MAAGLGYKEFTTGDVLTAADANGYLASQVVMVFASAAARTSAIASPQEGMISFLKDTNSTEYYSGSAWVAIGGASGGFTYAAYTPTFTNFTLGNGTINTARWAQSGKMVHVYGQVTLGSTSSVSGAITVSLPATASSSAVAIYTGWATFNDDGVGSYTGFARITSTTAMRLDPNKSDGTYNLIANTSATVPMTWTTNDDFRFSLVYEAA